MSGVSSLNNRFPFSTVQLLDTPLSRQDQLASFGLTNSLLTVTETTQQALLHFWTLPPTLILGLKDKHLPDLSAALQSITKNGYDYFLRNSGGLCVVSDGGILNVSLFLPQAQTRLPIDAAYEIMKSLISRAFPQLTIASYEITHSYCPGDFDLSVDGRKFAGISQRRTPGGLVVMAYISVTGDQQFRGALVRDFYQIGLAGQPNQWDFPVVWPESMANLDTLLAQPLTIATAKKAILEALVANDVTLDSKTLPAMIKTESFNHQYQNELQRMVKRQRAL